MGLFKDLKDKFKHKEGLDSASAPPAWSPAPETSHALGKWNEAPGEEYDAAEQFCAQYPRHPPRLLPSDAVDVISRLGCAAWGIVYPSSPRFAGTIHNADESKTGPKVVSVSTQRHSTSVCLLSNLPILAGLYDVQGKTGVYFEVTINRMDGIISVGTACLPYPAWRHPGWNRMSAGFHLDDFRKFFEDPDGGRDYTDAISHIRSGDIVGCGYEFATGALFYTYNGSRLPNAFTGIYIPRHQQDVFAAIGVEGHTEFQVNFGGDVFRWKEGNEWAWRVEGHVGRLGGGSGLQDDELPAYQ